MAATRLFVVIALAYCACHTPYVTAQLPPYPVPSCDVTVTGLPQQSNNIHFRSPIQDYFAVRIISYDTRPVKTVVTCKKGSENGCGTHKSMKDFLEPMDHIFKSDMDDFKGETVDYRTACCNGFMDDAGNFYDTLTFYPAEGVSPGVILVTPHVYYDLDNAAIKETDYWSLVSSAIVPANQSHTISIKESYGVDTTDSSSLSFSNGVMTQTSWGKDLGTYTKQVSNSLTRAYQHSVEIDVSVSITQGFNFDKLPVAQVDGVYELLQKYETLVPWPASTYVNQFNRANDDQCTHTGLGCWHLFFEDPYVYSSRTFLQIVGTDGVNC